MTIKKDPIAHEMMKKVGEQLFLKEHFVEDGKNKNISIFGPADIELHKGYEGKTVYCIDVARLFPPDKGSDPRSIFYSFLRPEFLQWYKTPLSSDAYSLFAGDGKERNEEEVTRASKILREERVPFFAQKFSGSKSLTKSMQKSGINCRYLGLVRSLSKDPAVQKEALMQMAYRVIAGILKRKFREEAERKKLCTKGAFFEICKKFYNFLLPSSCVYFRDPNLLKKEIENKYGGYSLFAEEKAPEFDLRKKVDIVKLFTMLPEKTGVHLKQEITQRLLSMSDQERDLYAFVNWDFQVIDSQVKGLAMSSFALAEGIKNQAQKKSFREKLHLLSISSKLMEDTGLYEIEHMLKWIETNLEILHTMFEQTKVTKEFKMMAEKQLEKVEGGLNDAQQLSSFFNMDPPPQIFLLWSIYHTFACRFVTISVLVLDLITIDIRWHEREKKIRAALDAIVNLEKCSESLQKAVVENKDKDKENFDEDSGSSGLSGSLAETELESDGNVTNKTQLKIKEIYYLVVDMFAQALSKFGDSPANFSHRVTVPATNFLSSQVVLDCIFNPSKESVKLIANTNKKMQRMLKQSSNTNLNDEKEVGAVKEKEKLSKANILTSVVPKKEYNWKVGLSASDCENMVKGATLHLPGMRR